MYNFLGHFRIFSIKDMAEEILGEAAQIISPYEGHVPGICWIAACRWNLFERVFTVEGISLAYALITLG